MSLLTPSSQCCRMLHGVCSNRENADWEATPSEHTRYIDHG